MVQIKSDVILFEPKSGGYLFLVLRIHTDGQGEFGLGPSFSEPVRLAPCRFSLGLTPHCPRIVILSSVFLSSENIPVPSSDNSSCA